MGPRLFSRGNADLGYSDHGHAGRLNGAATLQSRKYRAIYRLHRRWHAALMGPRLFSRGNPAVTTFYCRTARIAFNGAATLQSRKLQTVS